MGRGRIEEGGEEVGAGDGGKMEWRYRFMIVLSPQMDGGASLDDDEL